MFTIEIQTGGLIFMKFVVWVYFEVEKVLRQVLTKYPDPQGQGAQNGVWGGSAASAVQLGENFTKTKLF
jgi:hypothetical protein